MPQRERTLHHLRLCIAEASRRHTPEEIAQAEALLLKHTHQPAPRILKEKTPRTRGLLATTARQAASCQAMAAVDNAMSTRPPSYRTE